MFGLGTLFYAILFLVNGVAVLSEDRFLNRIGWSSSQPQTAFGGYDPASANDGSLTGVKSRLVNLISATRTLLRIPLIVVNILVVLYSLVLG